MSRTVATGLPRLAGGTTLAMYRRMSVARPVFKEVQIFLTRRCRGRCVLLRPSKRTNQIVEYVLACMAKKWNMSLHAYDFLGNHWHAVFTDHDGQVPAFQRDCHQFIARALNCAYGDRENVWSSSEQTSNVRLEEPDDMIGEIAYTMANPVRHGLVRYGKNWPGARRCWPSKPKVIRKPRWFFRGADDGGKWPDEVVLELVRPPGYEELSDEELEAMLEAAIVEAEEGYRRQADAEGKTFVGRKAVLATPRHWSPDTEAPRFNISPRVASRNRKRRIARLQANKRWLAAYRAALKKWRAGDRDVEFPAGTYKMRVVHSVRCAAPD